MKQVNSGNFESEVLKNEKFVVVDFWASWCHPCLRFAPVFENVSKSFSDAVFVKLNVDENPEIASNFGVMSIPTVKIFKAGEIIGEAVGSLSEEDFMRKLESIMR